MLGKVLGALQVLQFFADEEQALFYLERMKAHSVSSNAGSLNEGSEVDLSFILCKGRNQGGIVRASPK